MIEFKKMITLFQINYYILNKYVSLNDYFIIIIIKLISNCFSYNIYRILIKIFLLKKLNYK